MKNETIQFFHTISVLDDRITLSTQMEQTVTLRELDYWFVTFWK